MIKVVSVVLVAQHAHSLNTLIRLLLFIAVAASLVPAEAKASGKKSVLPKGSSPMTTVTVDLEFDGIADDASAEACKSNTERLSNMLQHNASNKVLRIAKVNQTFYFYPGIYASHIENAVLIIDGTMRFERPKHGGHDDSSDATTGKALEFPVTGRRPSPCWMLDQSHNITLTSLELQMVSQSNQQGRGRRRGGCIDGRGSQYWGVPGIGYLQMAEHRPRLLQINLTTQLTISNLIFQDSPYHTIYLEAIDGAHIYNVSIVARRTYNDGHGWIDLTAFNTDGIDVSGTNVHVHDVDIWTQDDCIAVKDSILQAAPLYESSNMLFERINCSGLGLVIGSIGGSTVQNITFRNAYLHRSVKGIYLKFRNLGDFWHERNLTGRIENVVFENITMEQPLQWPIWMGPAQQSDERRPCVARPCSLCWPQNPAATCHAVDGSVYRNIALRNVQINNPIMSPGVLLGQSGDNDSTHAHTVARMENIVFDNVRVTQGPPLEPATVDRSISFPGLLQPIDDHYVPKQEQVQLVQSAVVAARLWPDPTLSETTGPLFTHDTAVDGKKSTDHHFWLTIGFVVWHVLLLLYFLRQRRTGAVSGAHVLYKVLESHSHRSAGDDELDGIMKENSNGNHSLDFVLHQKRGTWSFWSPTWQFAVTLLALIAELVLVTAFFNTVVVLDGSTTSSSSWASSWHTTPKWNRVDQYFRCQGVVNGVAKGGTWPVPSCFTSDP